MIYYALITVFLSAIDAFRIWWKNKRVKHPVGNNDIKHGVSITLAIVAGLIGWVVMHGLTISWSFIPFVIGCFAIRGMLYDPALNLMRRESIDYVSGVSSSREEARLMHIPFWWRRAGYAGLFIVVLIVNYFL
jgi:hypothetical protein